MRQPVILSLPKTDLADYTSAQLDVFFPDGDKNVREALRRHIDGILDRTEYCFLKVENRYFKDGGNTIFNHLNADQYAMFLYFAANTLYREGESIDDCTKIFQLNRALHGIDAFYEVELPDVFLFVHPIGTILGRAEYADYLLVYQRCSVGSNHDIYPRLGKHFCLHPGAAVLGDCHIGDNCKISTGSLLMDHNLADNSLYIGNPSAFEIKPSPNRHPIWVTAEGRKRRTSG